jgi:hypothetical protein
MGNNTTQNPLAGKSTFDPNAYMMKLKGKDYLPVAPRIAWMRSEHPEWGIVTEEIAVTENYARFRTSIFNDEGRVVATATKCEDVKGFADFVEKAETGSVGRALALCGYGTLQCLEMEEGARLADSPVTRQSAPSADDSERARLQAVREARDRFLSVCDQKKIPYRGEDGKISPDLIRIILTDLSGNPEPPITVEGWDTLAGSLLQRRYRPQNPPRIRQPSPPPDMTPEELEDPFLGEEVVA